MADIFSGITSGINNLFNVIGFGRQWYMQDEMMRREDTAIQRRVADLKAAGLSPVLAAGQGAQAQAPQRLEVPKIENPILAAAQIQSISLGLEKEKQEIELMKKEQTRRDLENEYYEDFLRERNVGKELQNRYLDESMQDRLFLLANKVTTEEKRAKLIEMNTQLSKVKIDNAWVPAAQFYLNTAIASAASIGGARRLDQIDKEIALKEVLMKMHNDQNVREYILKKMALENAAKGRDKIQLGPFSREWSE